MDALRSILRPCLTRNVYYYNFRLRRQRLAFFIFQRSCRNRCHRVRQMIRLMTVFQAVVVADRMHVHVRRTPILRDSRKIHESRHVCDSRYIHAAFVFPLYSVITSFLPLYRLSDNLQDSSCVDEFISNE